MKKAPDEFCVEKKCAVCRQPVFYDGFTYEGYTTFDGLLFYCPEHWGEDGRTALEYEEKRGDAWKCAVCGHYLHRHGSDGCKIEGCSCACYEERKEG